MFYPVIGLEWFIWLGVALLFITCRPAFGRALFIDFALSDDYGVDPAISLQTDKNYTTLGGKAKPTCVLHSFF